MYVCLCLCTFVCVCVYVCMCVDICVCVYVFIQDPDPEPDPDPGSDPKLCEKSDPDPKKIIPDPQHCHAAGELVSFWVCERLVETFDSESLVNCWLRQLAAGGENIELVFSS